MSRVLSLFALSMVLLSCGGGGDGGTPPLTVANVAITAPAGNIAFQTLGRTRQFSAVATATGGATVPGAAFSWSSSNQSVATVDGNGLVTAVANGTTDITATSDGHQSPARTVTVAQVVGNVLVSSTTANPDTLFAATRTRQFTAVARDSANNTVAGAPAIVWSSSGASIATVNAGTGLVTAVDDGTTNINATSGTVVGSRPIIVRRLPQTHNVTPNPTASITTAAGTQIIVGTASDSSGAGIPITWLARTPGIVSLSPTTGFQTTATAAGNGSTRIVSTIAAFPGGLDSMTLTVSNQPVPNAPATITINVGNDFFKSTHNTNPQTSPAVDTVAVGGTVTWQWLAGAVIHNVTSQGAPSFTPSGGDRSSGTHVVTFNAAGSYAYVCSIHGPPMSGTIVVR